MSIALKRIIFFSYLLLLIFAAAFPFTSTDIAAMNNTYVMSFRLDHVMHVLAFLPLYALGVWLFQPISRKGRVYLLLIGLVIAALTEYIQLFINYRTYNPADLIANLSGVLLGAIIMLVVKKIKRFKPYCPHYPFCMNGYDGSKK